jgi:hypothetical protein
MQCKTKPTRKLSTINQIVEGYICPATELNDAFFTY